MRNLNVRSTWAVALFSLVLVASLPAAAVVPANFVDENVVSGLDQPTAIAWASDGRMFIAQRAGTVRVYQSGVLLPDLFVDLQDRVNSHRGMLGLAVHPQFPTVPYIYLAYTYDPPELPGVDGAVDGPDGNGSRAGRVVRIEADPAQGFNQAIPGSEVILVGANSTFDNMGDPLNFGPSPPACTDESGNHIADCMPVDANFHSVDDLKFLPDGSLLVSNGDGVVTNNNDNERRAQSLDSLAGKILRIDAITGNGFADNPFYDGDVMSNSSRVYCYGLRNPFRFAVHPFTGQLAIGDVGAHTWEEFSLGGRGDNFGWPCYEGGDGSSEVQPNFATYPECLGLTTGDVVAPAYSLFREGSSGSAIGGAFYTLGAYPFEYHGSLFIADRTQKWIRYLRFDGGNVTLHEFATGLNSMVQVVVGPDTHVYYVQLSQGNVQRIRYDLATASPASRTDVSLSRAVPNPFNPATTLEYHLDVAGHARLVLYDAAGRIVRRLVDGGVDSGSHRVVWDGRDDDGRAVGSGIYYARLEVADGATRWQKMALVR